MALFAESVQLTGGAAQSESPTGEERRARPREPQAEPAARRDLAASRRDQSTEQQIDSSLRAMRDRLQQR